MGGSTSLRSVRVVRRFVARSSSLGFVWVQWLVVVRLSVEAPTLTNITTDAFFASELGKKFFFQKNNTIWYSFYSKSSAILKKYKFSVSKKPIFSKETQVLTVLGNLTISVAFFGKSGTIWGKRERNWQTSGKNTLVWVLWEAAVMYLFIQFIKLAWRIWNCFSSFEILLLSFFKVVLRERYWLYCGQPVCFPNPTKEEIGGEAGNGLSIQMTPILSLDISISVSFCFVQTTFESFSSVGTESLPLLTIARIVCPASPLC